MLWLYLVVRIVTNPCSNVLQKLLTQRTAEPLFVIAAVHGLLTIVCLPWLILNWPPASPTFWFNMAVCTILTVVGNVLIVMALRLSDLSVLGPINAYKPVVSLLPSLLLLHELPSLLAMCGMVLVVAGSYGLAKPPAPATNTAAATTLSRWTGLLTERGVQYRVAALVVSATEAVFLKQALLVSSPLHTFCCWGVLGFVAAAPAVWLWQSSVVRRHQQTLLWTERSNYLWLAVTTGLMQLCTIFILADFAVGAALALFQTSALLSVVLGYRLFNEPHFLARLSGAAVMVAGAVLIVLGR